MSAFMLAAAGRLGSNPSTTSAATAPTSAAISSSDQIDSHLSNDSATTTHQQPISSSSNNAARPRHGPKASTSSSIESSSGSAQQHRIMDSTSSTTSTSQQPQRQQQQKSSPSTTTSTTGAATGTGKSHSKSNSASQDHCSFCLLAEFDIDKGSTLTYQYPEPTGHDPHMLAELMLPDGAHARHEDWTIFFLKPPEKSKPKKSVWDDYDDDDGTGRPRERSNGNGNKQDPPTATEDLTFVINLVRTKHDNTVRRGAMVKAMCVGTRHPWIQVFKPLLLVALDRYYNDPEPEHLERLFDAINQLDLTLIPNFTREEKLILRGTDRRDLFDERFIRVNQSTSASADFNHQALTGAAAQQQQAQPTLSTAGGGGAEEEEVMGGSTRSQVQGQGPTSDSRNAPRINTSVAHAPTSSNESNEPVTPASLSGHSLSAQSVRGKKKDTRFYSIMSHYNKLPIPLHIPLTLFPEEIGDYSMIQLVTTFSGPNSMPTGPLHPHLHSNGSQTHPIVLLFNAMATQKRVMFLGHGQAAGNVASYVLAASALGSGCGVVFQGFAGRVFPYTNLTNLDELETVAAYIAGVTNPRFEDLNAWDVLFNVETGKVTVSKNIEPAPPMQHNPRPALGRSESISNGSIKSTPGTVGMGHATSSSIAAKEDVIKTSASIISSGGGGYKNPLNAVPEARADAADNLFMEDVMAAIHAHAGEDYVRQRFVEHAQNFARIVARHEEHFYGHTSIGPTSQPFLNGQLGSGALPYGDRDSELRDIQLNAMRAEGWRSSHSYKLFREDEAQRLRSRSISSFDCPYQIGRLRRSKMLAPGEADMIFEAIASAVQTSPQIIELLSLLPSHSGGLTPIALGVFHPSVYVRANVVDIFTSIASHPVGVKLLQNINTFVRLALARLLHARAEPPKPTPTRAESIWSSPTPTLGIGTSLSGAATINGSQTPTRDGIPAFYQQQDSAGFLPKNWGTLLAPSNHASRSPSPASGLSVT